MAPTHAEVIARSEALLPRLAANANEAEVLRRLPDSTLAAVLEADLYPMIVPTSLGGHGLGLASIAQSTRTLGRACPASAWTISFLVLHSWLLTRFPSKARDELFSLEHPYALAPAPHPPTGTLQPVDGGFVLSGRWEWATAINHGDWVMVHAIVDQPDVSETRFAVLPIDQVEVDDVWFMSGMRATGSNTVRIEDVVVPTHRTLLAGDLLLDPAEPLEGDGMAGLPVMAVLGLVAAAPALGAAEAAVELFRQRIAERVLAYTLGDKAKDQPAAQIRLATVMSDLADAVARWERAIADVTSAAAVGPLSPDQRAAARLAAAATVRTARRVIATVAEGAGATVYNEASPLQRLQRDVEVLKGHVVFDWDRTAEVVGRVALGLPLRPTDMV